MYKSGILTILSFVFITSCSGKKNTERVKDESDPIFGHTFLFQQSDDLNLDVDFIVESTLAGLVDAVRGCDIGLNQRDPLDSPWLDVIANIIVANPTPAARRYFAAVKNYALDFLRREPDAWLVDQAALYCVLKMLERYGAPPAVAWIPADKQTCLWHIGHAYDHLLDDPRFRKYADAPAA